MIKQAKNMALVEGLLLETDVRLYEDGHDATYMGKIIILVEQTVDSEDVETLEIPISVYQKKLKKNGEPNPGFQQIDTVLKEFKSVASFGKEEATKIRATGNSLSTSEYFTPDLRFSDFPQVRGFGFQQVSPTVFKPRAIWELEGAIVSMDYQIDSNGIETDAFEMKILTFGYNEYAQVIPLITRDKNIIPAIQATYSIGQTATFKGKLRFSSVSDSRTVEVAFGEAEVQTTRLVSEIVITAGDNPLDASLGYTQEEIDSGLVARVARIEGKKKKTEERGSGMGQGIATSAPKSKSEGKSSKPSFDLGY